MPRINLSHRTPLSGSHDSRAITRTLPDPSWRAPHGTPARARRGRRATPASSRRVETPFKPRTQAFSPPADGPGAQRPGRVRAGAPAGPGPHGLLRLALWMALLQHVVANGAPSFADIRARPRREANRLNRILETHRRPIHAVPLSSTPSPAAPLPAAPLPAAPLPAASRNAWRGTVCAPADWRGLAANEKTGRGLACAAPATNGTLDDAIEPVRAGRRWVIDAWRAGNTALARQAAWRATPHATRETLRTLTRLAAFVEQTPDASADAIVAKARALLASADVAFDDIDAVYARQLWLDVDDWLDIAALGERSWSPVELLGHAYRWCGLDLSVDLSPGYAPLGPFDRCAGELAAVLHARTRRLVPQLTALTGFAAVSADFERELRHDLCTRAGGVALLPITASAPNATAVWFDGTALRGAVGMGLSELTAYLASHADLSEDGGHAVSDVVPARCRSAPRTRAALTHRLRLRLQVLQESTDYRFGTPHQSLATTVLRLGPLHGIGTHNLGDPEDLVERYRALEAAWEASPRYPVAPHLVAAFHLAQSSDVLIHDGNPVGPQVIERVRREFAPAIDHPGTLPAVRAWLAEKRLVLWSDLPGVARDPALASAPRALREAAGEYRRLLGLPERLVVPTGEAGAQVLGAYLAERLQAYGAVPVPTRRMVRLGDIPPPPKNVLDVVVAIARARLKEMRRLQRHRIWRHADVAAPRERRAASAHPDPVPLPVPVPVPDPGAAELAHDAREAATRLLIVSQMARQTEDHNARAIDFVPFAGSVYTLGAGLWKRDAGLALRGAFGFGIDALFVWIGGATERMVARQAARLVSEVGLTPHEPRALAMLAELGELLDVTRPGELPAGNVVVNPDPCGVTRLAETPLAHAGKRVDATPDAEALPEALPEGDAGPARGWRQENTRENSPNMPTDSVSAESTDPDAGSVVSFEASLTCRVMHPVQSDAISTGSVPSRFPATALANAAIGRGARPEGGTDGILRAGLRRRRPSPHRQIVRMHSDETKRTLSRMGSDVGAGAVHPASFLKRATVARAQEFIRARDFIERISDDASGDAAPRIGDLVRIEVGADAQAQRDFQIVHDTLQALCEGSQTLRALLRAALKTRTKPASPFSLRFMSGTPPRCDLERRLIVLPRVAQPFETRYVDARGLTPFQRERAWLHELVHALTGIEDVGSEERVSHRGAVVYFTDRILFEAGPELPERIMYQHAKGAFASGHARAPDPVIDAARQEAVETVLAEDTFLDTLLRRRMKWGGTETILGTLVKQRLTVTQVLQLRGEIDGWMGDDASLRLSELTAFLRHVFRVSVDSDTALGTVIERGAQFVRILEKAYREDNFICFLVNRWYADAARRPRWRVQWGQRPHADAVQGWSINREAHSLTMYEEPLFYASQQGPRLLEEDRRLAGALIALITPATEEAVAPAQQRLNRGLRVYLENRVMALLRPGRRGDPDPPQRVSAEWRRDAAALWPSIGKARRAAEAEDAWLAKNVA